MSGPQAHLESRKPAKLCCALRHTFFFDPANTRLVTYIFEESEHSTHPTGGIMWITIEPFLTPVFRACQHLDRQEWIGVFFAALVIGYFCMRGFGSRANY